MTFLLDPSESAVQLRSRGQSETNTVLSGHRDPPGQRTPWVRRLQPECPKLRAERLGGTMLGVKSQVEVRSKLRKFESEHM